MSAVRVIVNGSKGRMGQAILGVCKRDNEIRVAAEVDQGDDLAGVIGGADVLIDFTHASVTLSVAELAAAAGAALVIGTTGHSDEERSNILSLTKNIPVVFAPNFSIGVNTLFWLTRKATEILGTEFDLEVVEMHHKLKKDAPSGTARRLAEILAEVRELSYNSDVRHGREGMVGERTPTEIGMHSIRGGDVVGDHTVIFATPGERVELTHKASSRDTFATGAVRAAKWVVGRPAGVYDMQDVLGLKD